MYINFWDYTKKCYFYRPQKLIWHGTNTHGERAMETYCDAWSSSSRETVGLASSLLSEKILDQGKFTCNNQFIVLCIEAINQETITRKKRNNNNMQETTACSHVTSEKLDVLDDKCK